MKISPENAAQLAEGAVAFVEHKFGFRLPYTPESLIVVDAIIDKVRATGATEEQAPRLLSELGCYVGEVLVKRSRASWRWASEMGMSERSRSPIVLAWPGASVCDPIGRVFQRFSHASTDGVAMLYETTVDRQRRKIAPGRL